MRKAEKRLWRVWAAMGTLACLAALAAAGQGAFGQSEPTAANAGPQPKAIIVDGQPALGLDYGDGMGFLMVSGNWQGEPAMRFSMDFASLADSPTDYVCPGYLWVSKDAAAFVPDEHFAHQDCGGFHVPRSDIKSASFDSNAGLVNLRMRRYGLSFCTIYDVTTTYLANWTLHTGYGNPCGVTEGHAKVHEIAVAGSSAWNYLNAAFNDFEGLQSEFRKEVLVPIETISAATRLGDEAERSGDNAKAFEIYVSALQGARTNGPSEIADPVRQRILALAPKINPRLAIPDEAQRYFFGSRAALQEWKGKGNTAKLDDAIEQLNEALRIAPWWPEAYFNRGVVLETRGRYADSVESFKLYLLAAPNASDATQVKQRIYMLEYKAREAWIKEQGLIVPDNFEYVLDKAEKLLFLGQDSIKNFSTPTKSPAQLLCLAKPGYAVEDYMFATVEFCGEWLAQWIACCLPGDFHFQRDFLLKVELQARSEG